MKLKELKKWLAIGVAVVMGLSVTACSNEAQNTAQQEAMVVEETTIESAAQEEAVEEEELVEEEEEEEADYELEEEEEEAVEEGEISFQEVWDSYEQLVALYNQVYDLYQSDDVPQSDDVEEILNDVDATLDEIEKLTEEDVPTDEDKLAVISSIGEVGATLNQLIDPLIEAANENVAEQDYYNRLLDVVQQNYDYMNAYFNSVWDHLAKYGGTDDQIEGVVAARDAIGDINNLSSSTSEELDSINDSINAVIDLLDAICGH